MHKVSLFISIMENCHEQVSQTFDAPSTLIRTNLKRIYLSHVVLPIAVVTENWSCPKRSSLQNDKNWKYWPGAGHTVDKDSVEGLENVPILEGNRLSREIMPKEL